MIGLVDMGSIRVRKGAFINNEGFALLLPVFAFHEVEAPSTIELIAIYEP